MRSLVVGFVSVVVAACVPGSVSKPDDVLVMGAATVVTGRLSIIYADDHEGGRSEVFYQLVEDSDPSLEARVFELDFEPWTERVQQTLQHDDYVRIRGVLWGDRLQVGADMDPNALSADDGAVDILATGAAAGTTRRTLVILANFNDSAVGCSTGQVGDLVLGANSGSINHWLSTLSNGTTGLAGDVVGPFSLGVNASSCDINGWASTLNTAAKAAGYDSATYTHVFYVMPTNGCGYAGYGTFGGAPSRAWIFYCGLHDVYAHELGHNMGMHHATSGGNEYGDTSCIMGLGGIGLRHLNGPHAVQMGWRSATDPQVGTYTLNELASAGAPVLKIPIEGTNQAYYVSYRNSAGYDAGMPSGYRQRTAVHRFSSGTTTTSLLALLDDGQSFQDSATGLILRQDAHSASASTVSVAYGCVTNAPSLSVAPSQRTAQPGATMTFDLTVKNNDARGCASRSLQLSASAGWPTSLSASQLTLAGGAAQVVQLQVTPPAGSTGAVDVAISLSDGSAVLASAGARAISDGTAPSTPGTLSASTSRKQITLTWGASSDDFGPVSYRVLRNGAVIATVNTTSYADRAVAQRTTYSYAVVAVDGAGNASGQSNAISATAGGGGKAR